MSGNSKRVGVVLFQLGGPDSLEAVEPFLFNLFCDPDIIDFPFSRLGRRALAKLISKTRAKKASQHYAAIGGSPIRRFTEQQADALEARLIREGLDARCVVAMRYWHPFTAEAVASTYRSGIGPGRVATSLSAILEHDHRQQLERVATSVDRRSPDFLRSSFLYVIRYISPPWWRELTRR